VSTTSGKLGVRIGGMQVSVLFFICKGEVWMNLLLKTDVTSYSDVKW
jgi:hypothetical protein